MRGRIVALGSERQRGYFGDRERRNVRFEVRLIDERVHPETRENFHQHVFVLFQLFDLALDMGAVGVLAVLKAIIGLNVII